jgi:AcrR family transcriptional regulator
MPRLWSETIDDHRRQVRAAILDSAADLVGEHGLMGVTMSHVAARAGIGRATLYKYFPDVESVLHAWHERHIADHLARLGEIRDQPGDARQRLVAGLTTYAKVCRLRERHGSQELGALLHSDGRVTSAEHQLSEIFHELLADAVAAGVVRDDISVDELAGYCVHALGAARDLRSDTAVRRLVDLTVAALHPPSAAS